MKRVAFLTAFSLVLAAAPVAAESLTDRIVAQLRGQGYHQIVISTTMLGRSRITAVSRTDRREIIVNPRTGEILRDYSESAKGKGGGLLGYDDDGKTGKGQANANANAGQGNNNAGGNGSGSAGGSGSGGGNGGGQGSGGGQGNGN